MIDKSNMILTENLYKVIIKLSLPIMLSNLIQTLYNLTDTYFVSRIGSEQVSAVGLVWSIVYLAIGLALGISIAARAIVSQYIGANDNENATLASGQALVFTLIISILFGIIGYFSTPLILKITGAQDIVLEQGIKYGKIAMMGIPLLFISIITQSIKQAEGDMVTPMIVIAISVGLNIVLDPIFMFTFNMGIEGAAYATIVSRLLFCIILIYRLFFSKYSKIKLKLKHLRINKDAMKKIIKIGIPASFGHIAGAIGFMVTNVFVISYGSDIMTTFIIGNRIISLIIMPSMGVGSAIATIVGQNMGKGNLERVRESHKKAVHLVLIVSILGMLLIYFSRVYLIKIFTNDAIIISHGMNFVNIIIFLLPMLGYFHVVSGVFTGSGHSIMSMIVMMSRLWVFTIPVIILFKYVFKMDEYAIWYPMFISNFMACIVGYLLYKSGRWKKTVIDKKVIEVENND